MTTIAVHGEFSPNPDEEDLWDQLQPLEVHPHDGRLVVRYYTPEEAARKEELYQRMERLMGPQPKKPKIVKDDAYYAIYESDTEEDERTKTPSLEVDPNLADRDLGPIFLTPEEEDLYIGSDDSEEGLTPTENLIPKEDSEEGLIPKEHLIPKADYEEGLIPKDHLIPKEDSKENFIPEEDLIVKDELSPAKDLNWQAFPLGENLAPQDDDIRTSTRTGGRGHRVEYEYDFRLKPGDVVMFLELRTEGKLPDPWKIQRYIEVHKDDTYFEDNGQYRLNFMDVYGPLYDGDMVVRFGNFNKTYHWNQHYHIKCYVYFSDVKPLENDNPPSGPWYWIEDLQLHQRSGPKRRVAIPNPVAENKPIREVVEEFALRDGDIVMTYIWDTKVPRFDRIKSYIWNPLLASIGLEKLINHEDRVLRYGVSFYDQMCQNEIGYYTVEVVDIHVELYSFRKTPFTKNEGEWLFLGRSARRFNNYLIRHQWQVNKIKKPMQVPMAGDILFDRGLRFALDLDPAKRVGPPKLWYPDLKIGGLVSFYTWEFLKQYGREPRPFVRITDVGKYGVGNTTMALRFGTFNEPRGAPESPTWTWRERDTVELYVINTRGSSWRRVAVSTWPWDMPRPLPNYNWTPHNLRDIEEVPRFFKPRFGDIVIRLSMDAEWVKMKSDPHLVGSTYNPHYDVNIRMGIYQRGSVLCEQGDYIVRAGYEQNHINSSWTNATVELYYMEGKDSWINTRSPWKFRGRDAYIFGTNSWRRGALEGVQQSGFGDMSVSDVEKLNGIDRTKFVELDPSEVWREKGLREAMKIGAEYQTG